MEQEEGCFLSDYLIENPEFPGLVLTGNAYDRGYQHGKRFKEEIARSIEYHLNYGGITYPKESWKKKARKVVKHVFIPTIKKHLPRCFEELEGISEGSGQSIKQIVMLNARQDLAAMRFDFDGPELDKTTGTSFYADSSLSGYFRGAGSRQPIAVHSWNRPSPAHHKTPVIYFEVQSKEKDPAHNRASQFIVTEPRVLMVSGINASGLCITSNAIFSSQDFKPGGVELFEAKQATDIKVHGNWKLHLPLTCIQWAMMQEDSVPMAQIRMVQYDTFAARHFLLSEMNPSTESGYSISVERATNSVVDKIIEPNGIFLHGNKFETWKECKEKRHEKHDVQQRFEKWKKGLDYPVYDDGARVRRLRGMFRNSFLSLGYIQVMFMDHDESVHPMCRHAKMVGGASKDTANASDVVIADVATKLVNQDKQPLYTREEILDSAHTASLVIYNLKDQVIALSTSGPPCKAKWVKFKFKRNLDYDPKLRKDTDGDSSQENSDDLSPSSLFDDDTMYETIEGIEPDYDEKVDAEAGKNYDEEEGTVVGEDVDDLDIDDDPRYEEIPQEERDEQVDRTQDIIERGRQMLRQWADDEAAAIEMKRLRMRQEEEAKSGVKRSEDNVNAGYDEDEALALALSMSMEES